MALEEKGLQGYISKLISFDKKEHKSEEVLKINPRGQVRITTLIKKSNVLTFCRCKVITQITKTCIQVFLPFTTGAITMHAINEKIIHQKRNVIPRSMSTFNICFKFDINH